MSENNIKILVTGAGGQLGQCIKQWSADFSYNCLFADSSVLDITNRASVAKVFSEYNPDIVINTAAYTKVDLAETEEDKAYAVNEEGVSNLVTYCEQNSTKLIHISTDYVFSGRALKPYKSDYKPAPNTVYGASKLAGEQVILNSELEAYWIIRTSWLYSEFGKNFYKTIQDLAKKLDRLKVVDDQIGSPTRAEDLAFFILRFLPELNPTTKGIYHFSNTGKGTWYDFAKAIIQKHNIAIEIDVVTSNEFPTAAERPAYSVLDTSKIKETFGFEIRSWRDALGS